MAVGKVSRGVRRVRRAGLERDPRGQENRSSRPDASGSHLPNPTCLEEVFAHPRHGSPLGSWKFHKSGGPAEASAGPCVNSLVACECCPHTTIHHSLWMAAAASALK